MAARRKTDAEKAVTRTLQKCRVKKPTDPAERPVSRKSRVTPPGFVRGEALEEWKRVAPLLRSLGLLTPLDRSIFAFYCKAYGEMVDSANLLDELAAEDRSLAFAAKAKRGGPSRSVLRQEHNRARADAAKYGALFGLNPFSRSRLDPSKLIYRADGTVDVTPEGAEALFEDENPLAKFMN